MNPMTYYNFFKPDFSPETVDFLKENKGLSGLLAILYFIFIIIVVALIWVGAIFGLTIWLFFKFLKDLCGKKD